MAGTQEPVQVHSSPTSTADDGVEETDRSRRRRRCPECGGDVVSDGQEATCPDCDVLVDATPIRRDVATLASDAETTSRTGPATSASRHDRGLGSEIDHRDRDANGNTLTGQRRQRVRRLRRRQRETQAKTRREETLRDAMGEVRRIAGSLTLPRYVRERAGQLAREAQREDLYQGRSTDALAAAAVYAACREHGLTRSVSTVARAAGVPARRDGAGQNSLQGHYQVLNVHLELATSLLTVTDWVPRLAATADVAAVVRRRAMTFAAVVEDNAIEFGGRAPSTLAATCLVLAAGDRARTQQSLVGPLDVSASQVRTAKPTVAAVLDDADLGCEAALAAARAAVDAQ